MKKIAILAFLLSASAWCQSVTFNWAGDGNTEPVCSTTKVSCISGLTLTDVTNASAPVVISSTISPTVTTYSISPLPAVGSHTWTLVVNGYDQSGNAISSPPATVTATVPSLTLNPPTGFTVTP